MDTALILQHPARSHLFEDPLWLWRHSNSSASMPVAWTSMVRQSLAGGSIRDAATRTGAQVSSDSWWRAQPRGAMRSRFSDPRISRPLRVVWRKCMRPTGGGRVNPRCGDCARGRAQPKPVSESICAATADSVPDLGSLVADAGTHSGAGRRRDRFSTIEQRLRRLCPWACAVEASVGERWRDGADSAVCRPWVSGHTDACTHVGAGGRWDRFSSIEKRRRE